MTFVVGKTRYQIIYHELKQTHSQLSHVQALSDNNIHKSIGIWTVGTTLLCMRGYAPHTSAKQHQALCAERINRCWSNSCLKFSVLFTDRRPRSRYTTMKANDWTRASTEHARSWKNSDTSWSRNRWKWTRNISRQPITSKTKMCSIIMYRIGEYQCSTHSRKDLVKLVANVYNYVLSLKRV